MIIKSSIENSDKIFIVKDEDVEISSLLKKDIIFPIPFSNDVIEHIQNKTVPKDNITLIQLITSLTYLKNRSMNKLILKHLGLTIPKLGNIYQNYYNSGIKLDYDFIIKLYKYSEINDIENLKKIIEQKLSDDGAVLYYRPYDRILLNAIKIAGKAGSKDILLYITDIILTRRSNNWYELLQTMLEYADIEIFKKFILEFKTNELPTTEIFGYGSIELVEFLINNRGSIENVHNFDKALGIAIDYKKTELIDYLLSKYDHDFKFSLYYAVKKNNTKLLELFLSDQRFDESCYNHLLSGSCAGNNKPLAEYALEKGADDLIDALEECCRGNSIEIAKIIISKGINILSPSKSIDNNKLLDTCLDLSISRNNMEIYNYLFNKYSSFIDSDCKCIFPSIKMIDHFVGMENKKKITKIVEDLVFDESIGLYEYAISKGAPRIEYYEYYVKDYNKYVFKIISNKLQGLNKSAINFLIN